MGPAVVAYTDNVALRHYKIAPNLSPRLVRWLGDIELYNLTIKHIPGATNMAADALSRLCPLITYVDGDSWVAGYRADPAFKHLFNAAVALASSDSLHRGRVWEVSLIRVPVGRVLEVIRNFHDGATRGHCGTAKR